MTSTRLRNTSSRRSTPIRAIAVMRCGLGARTAGRAETANFLAAPGLASKTRHYFEPGCRVESEKQRGACRFVRLLPGSAWFSGRRVRQGGRILAQPDRGHQPGGRILRPLLSLRRRGRIIRTLKIPLRRANLQAAPRQVGRVIDLAKFLANQGRARESDAVFAKAERDFPNKSARAGLRKPTCW